MNTDERNRINVNCISNADSDSFFSAASYFSPLFLIRVHPCESVVSNLKCQKNRGERLTPGCGAGMETLGRVNDGATGGMSADILLAHYIAAAKVRSNLFELSLQAVSKSVFVGRGFSRNVHEPETPGL
jgi:hypothetical protein